jgi:hypothetical protein
MSGMIIDVLLSVSVVGLGIVCYIQIQQIREMRKIINDNFKHVKKDIMLLDRRTRHLPDEKKAGHHIMPLPMVITGDDN